MKAKLVVVGCSMVLLTALPALAEAAKETAADLASTLQTQRDVCTTMAAQAKSAYDLAQFKAGLERDTDALKVKMDARVYGVGHGSRQTAEYYAQRLQSVMAEQQVKDKATADDFRSAGEKVDQCLTALKEQGKATYVAFKARNVDKSVRTQAETLMTAWLANINEINTGSPNGSDSSFTTWKSAKVQAEVSSL